MTMKDNKVQPEATKIPREEMRQQPPTREEIEKGRRELRRMREEAWRRCIMVGMSEHGIGPRNPVRSSLYRDLYQLTRRGLT